MNFRNHVTPRLVVLFAAGVPLLLLNSCGGGSGTSGRPEPVDQSCDSTSFLDGGVCRQFAVRIDARAETSFVEDGQPVSLEVVLFRPIDEGRYPLVVFNHGSTGDGSDPALFTRTFTSKAVSRYFVDRGWMVAFPQRRGRGRSDGLYDEGFQPDRSNYSCDAALALGGAERALEDLDAVTDWLVMRDDVDTTRMVISGTSRGGILSIAYPGRRPDVYLGGINFVGGWIGEGCGDYRDINRSLFVGGAAFPGTSLWLYGTNDSFYSIAHSRSNFDAFTASGGVGRFLEFSRAPGLNGHFLVNDRELWQGAVDQWLDEVLP